MGAVVIKIEKKNNKLINRLIKELGSNILSINDEQFEDIALAKLMENEKTNETVSREIIMNKLINES